MGSVKIILTCPICGNSKWVKNEDEEYVFQCLSCGSTVNPENMRSSAEEVIYLTDITGVIGEWLGSEFDSEVPKEVINLLRMAYEMSVTEYENNSV